MRILTKQRKMILEAALACGLALLTLSYSAFAWYLMNRTVKAEGMTLHASVPQDLEISLTGEEGTWTENLVINEDNILTLYGFDTTKDLYIMPASSYEGVHLFETSRSLLNGEPLPGAYYRDATGLALVDGHYEGYYVDIPLFFRTSKDAVRSLYLELDFSGIPGTTIAPKTGSPDLYHTARVAFLNPAKTANSVGNAAPLVLTPQETVDSRRVITSSVVADGAPVDPSFLLFTDGRYSDEKIVMVDAATYTGSTVEYHPVQINLRIWIEGQDRRCINGIGGQSFEIGLRFSDPTNA